LGTSGGQFFIAEYFTAIWKKSEGLQIFGKEGAVIGEETSLQIWRTRSPLNVIGQTA